MESPARVDLGLSNALARPTLLFGWVVLLIGALIGGALPPLERWGPGLWFVVAVIAIDFAIVTARRPGPLSRPVVAVVVGLSAAALAVVLLVLDDALGEGVAYALGYLNLGVSLLIVRGHPAIGTASSVLVGASLVWWSTTRDGDPLRLLERLAPLLVVLLGCWMLQLIGRSIAGVRSRTLAQQLRTVAETDAVLSGRAEEHRARAEITARVEPLLRRIAAGEELGAALHAEVAAADAEVRGRLRRDLPSHAGFLRAVADARERGVAVRLIGSEEPSPGPMPDALAERLVALLAADGTRSATVRFLPRSRGATTSLLIEGRDGRRRHEFDAEGSPVGEPA